MLGQRTVVFYNTRKGRVTVFLDLFGMSMVGVLLTYGRETWSWDVRTKHVSYEPVPTIEGVRALANYGPTATLFTLGPNHTVQQYELSPPALVRTVRHEPAMAPAVTNSSLQSTPQMKSHVIPGAAPPVPVQRGHEMRSNPASLSTIQRAANEMQAIEHARNMRAQIGSPDSTMSRTESVSSRSSGGGGGRYQRNNPSVSSYAASGTTFSTFSPSMIGRDSMTSPFFPRGTSVASSGRRSKGSRLRQEVLLSPEGNFVDLFPYTRARLSSLPYTQPQALDQTNSSADDLRKQMLQVVFGWEDDIEPMIRDEINHHTPGSMNAVLLSKWLGEVDVNMMAAAIASGSAGSSDWMLLALSQMDGQGSTSVLGQAFVQRLLQQGDIHTSATILLGMGDKEDAVEVYVSRNFYMEAILLTCLLFPTDWQRQAHLVRRWGEFVVENSQQHLAIRCFSCTGVDSSMPWVSPNQSPFAGGQTSQSLPQIISPPTSPPPNNTRMTTKNSSLKLITSFGGADQTQYRFPGLRSDDHTPTNAPGVTPIAESALSPGGTPSTYLRPQLPRAKNNLTVRTVTPGGYTRNRLPSIGETPVDVVPPTLGATRPSALPTPNDSGSDKEKENRSSIQMQEVKAPEKSLDDPPLTLSSARYDPGSATPQQTPQTAVPSTAIKTSLASLTQDRFSTFKDETRLRNGSRDRKPDGLHIQMPSLNQLNLNAYATSASGSARSDHNRSNTWSSLHSNGSGASRFDNMGDTRSPPLTGQSSTSSAKSPSISGRSMDQYISSLEEANFRSQKQKADHLRRHQNRDDHKTSSGYRQHKSRSKPRHREPSEDRGRGGQKYIRPAKRSPSSPIPMSPEDLQQYREANTQNLGAQMSRDSSPDEIQSQSRGHSSRRNGAPKTRSTSKTSDYSHCTVRRVSPGGGFDSQLGSEASNSRKSSRRPSPNGLLSPSGRGRSKSKNNGSTLRSPSSPLPMSPQARLYRNEDDEDPFRIVEADRNRLRSAQRSTSRRPRERGTSARREASPDRRRLPDERPLYQKAAADQSQQQDVSIDQKTSDGDAATSDSNAPSLHHTKSRRTLKKEMAARELEARRESLTQRSMASIIPHPQSLSGRPMLTGRSQTDLGNSPTSWGGTVSPLSSSASLSGISEYGPNESRSASVGPYGLPATPRAMRHPKYQSRDTDYIPAIPELPNGFNPSNGNYATGQPMRELPRSLSAPIPEPDVPTPIDMPMHPAFHRGLRPSAKRPNFSPLGDIGKHQRRPSLDAPQFGVGPTIASIGETLHEAEPMHIVSVVEEPPLLPELQHLASNSAVPPPPPPPPPPPSFHSDDGTHHSMSSGSGVGVINIVMDDNSRIGTPIVEVPSAVVPEKMSSPPLTGGSTPPVSGGHRRGRSIDHFNVGKSIKGMAERMRSTSRGRNNGNITRSPRAAHEVSAPAPYESLPQYF